MPAPTPGITLGHYQLKEQIGMGGMATVFKAWQPNMNRHVAIKVLPDHLARDSRFTARFSQEVRTIARLEHRNILPVYDYGEEQGTAYLVMRYLDGGTLGEILTQGRLGLHDTIEIITQICAALDYAHRQGIVHRDIKPANIMVDNEGHAYLTDFGIAKVLESTESLTQTGVAIGTPEYMAPEQALGEQVDGRTDIYALGIILYQLAVGNTPYHANTPMAIALAHIHEPLPLPSMVNPDVPEAVERIILKALAKDPNDRYQTASEMAQALKSIVHSSQTAEIKIADLGNLPDLIEKIQHDRPAMPVDDIPPGTYTWQTPPPPPTTIEAPRRKLPIPPAIFAVVSILIVIGLIWLGSSLLQDDEPTRLPAPTSFSAGGGPLPGAGGPGGGPPPGGGPEGGGLAPGDYLYDNFDLSEYDGNFDTRIWNLIAWDGPGCEMVQQEGTLHIISHADSAQDSACELFMTRPPKISGPLLESLEARMQILDGHNNKPISAALRAETTYGDDSWGVECGISASTEPVLLMRVDDDRQSGDEPAYSAEQPLEYNTWYTVRLNVDVETFTISCLLDGEEIGSYDPEDAYDFARGDFERLIASWGSEGAAGTILVDNFTKIVP